MKIIESIERNMRDNCFVVNIVSVFLVFTCFMCGLVDPGTLKINVSVSVCTISIRNMIFV